MSKQTEIEKHSEELKEKLCALGIEYKVQGMTEGEIKENREVQKIVDNLTRIIEEGEKEEQEEKTSHERRRWMECAEYARS